MPRRNGDDGESGESKGDADQRGPARPLAAGERVGDRDAGTRHSSRWSDEADQTAPHRGVEDPEAERDGDAARRRPAGVGPRDADRPDRDGRRNREDERDQLGERSDADSGGSPGDDAAEEVGAADEDRRREGEQGRHGAAPVEPSRICSVFRSE